MPTLQSVLGGQPPDGAGAEGVLLDTLCVAGIPGELAPDRCSRSLLQALGITRHTLQAQVAAREDEPIDLTDGLEVHLGKTGGAAAFTLEVSPLMLSWRVPWKSAVLPAGPKGALASAAGGTTQGVLRGGRHALAEA